MDDRIAAARTVPQYLRALRDAYGPRTAVVGERRRVSYDELDAGSALWARGLLDRGVSKGSRIGVLLGNGPDWVQAWAAAARIGAVPVALSTFAKASELARVVRHADLQGIVTLRHFLGDDVLARLEAGLPGLAEQQGEVLALPSAPWLRWVVALGGGDDLPSWARPSSWLAPVGRFTPFGDEILRAAEAEVHPNDHAIMIYTSGSTADPKGVPHTNDTILRKTRDLTEMFQLPDGVRSYTASPFFWVGGLTMSLFPVLSSGGTQYCTDRFDAGQVLRLIADERIERTVLYPHHIDGLLAHPDFPASDRSSLREGDARILPPGVRSPARADGLRIGLGMTETFGGYWWGVPDPTPDGAPFRPGDRRPPPLDRLQPGVELEVADADGRPVGDGERGEICIRGVCITPGLHKADRSLVFDADGWFHTGDEGEVDGRRVRFVGRLGDMIKTAGANVAPPEVVAVLMAQPGVAVAHVVGLPDPVRGQVVVAAVVAKEGESVDVPALRAAAQRDLATYKVPAHVVVLDEHEIPWTASHKVAKAALASLLADRIAALREAPSS